MKTVVKEIEYLAVSLHPVVVVVLRESGRQRHLARLTIDGDGAKVSRADLGETAARLLGHLMVGRLSELDQLVDEVHQLVD